MEKTKLYNRSKFSVETIKQALSLFYELVAEAKIEKEYIPSLTVNLGEERWDYDDENEFFADYRKNCKFASYSLYGSDLGLRIDLSPFESRISVNAPNRAAIEKVFDIFETNRENAELEPNEEKPTEPIIFIGHGHSVLWRDLKDHLQDKHGLEVIAYETGARAGHVIRDILDDLASEASMALLVLTADDEQKDGTFHARQNVIHETGLFQGRLGFSRAIVLLEEGAEPFSNLQGIEQIRFSKGNIKETFGEVLATIKREFNS
ncbi:MAG: nucleotide-binding protein [Rickettsiales bacterium]